MLNQLLSVFLESPCELCDRPVSSCISDRNRSDRLCEYCFNRLSWDRLTSGDRKKLFQAQSTFAWGRYDGQLKRAIALMKYNRQPEIGKILGTLLGQVWFDSGLIKLYSKVTVVPIPMYHQKQRLRGFNQAEIIARSFCLVTGYQLSTKALVRIRDTAAMFDLGSLSARAKNLERSIEVGAKLPKYPVLLIDDVHTTGTTVKEATKVLSHKKIEVFGVAVAAKAGASIP